jgi:segregation and condensation protein A
MGDYKVQLETYSGPMDLLLYLIRREEVDIYDIPISRILEQYLGYVHLLEELDPDAVGDFLVMAATLVEIKSRTLLPKPPPEVEDDDGLDPRADLVRQLLAYRSFREAAVKLEERADIRSKQFGRPPTEVPEDEEQQEVDLEDAQIWDLMTAFNKLLASVGQRRTTHDVVYDDTPVTLHATDILDRLEREGPEMPFESLFEGRRRSEMIGLFLALLELIRQKRVQAQQDTALGGITVHLLDATPIMETTVTGGVPEVGGGEEEQEAAEVEAETEEEAEPGEAEEPVMTGQSAGEESEADEDELFLDEEESEFLKQLDAVQVSDVDLTGGAKREPAAEAADETASEAESEAEDNIEDEGSSS